MDIALDGMTATIVAIEQDYENRVHLAVTVDDDPGSDLGRDGKPGHRFFFGIDEVEPAEPGVRPTSRRSSPLSLLKETAMRESSMEQTSDASSANEARDILCLSGGAALIVLGAGLAMAHPFIRRSARRRSTH